MTALGWLLIGVMLIVTGTALTFAWYYAAELDRVQRLHGRHGTPARPVTARHDVTREARSTLLGPAETAAHADAMHAASEPYLPDPRAIPTADGEHVTCPACGFRDGRHNPAGCRRQEALYVRAGRAVEPVKADGHAPWTGSQPALDDEALSELDRVRYIRAQLDGCGDTATADDLRRVLDGLRTYGQAPVADVLEGERLAAVMQP